MLTWPLVFLSTVWLLKVLSIVTVKGVASLLKIYITMHLYRTTIHTWIIQHWTFHHTT